MADLTLTGLGILAIVNVFEIGLTQDIVPNVYCNKKQLTWDKALHACQRVKGTLLPFVTGLGLNMANIYLKNEADIWTGDYALESKPGTLAKSTFCSFQYMTNDSYYNPELYADCFSEKNILCWNYSKTKLLVMKGPYPAISCPHQRFSFAEIHAHRRDIRAGYYWSRGEMGVTVASTTEQMPSETPDLCGAYRKDSGQFFDNCNAKRLSLCYSTHPADMSFDKSCFDNDIHVATTKALSKITYKVTSRTTRGIYATTLTKATATTSSSVPTNIPRGETTLQHGLDSSPMHSRTLQTKLMQSEDRNVDKHTDKSQNVGVTLGLSVGGCFVVISGVVITVFIVRRHHCRREERKYAAHKSVRKNGTENEGHLPEDGVVRNHHNVQTTQAEMFPSINRTNEHTYTVLTRRDSYNYSTLNFTDNPEPNSNNTESLKMSFSRATEYMNVNDAETTSTNNLE